MELAKYLLKIYLSMLGKVMMAVQLCQVGDTFSFSPIDRTFLNYIFLTTYEEHIKNYQALNREKYPFTLYISFVQFSNM